jgi:hypothetical protein
MSFTFDREAAEKQEQSNFRHVVWYLERLAFIDNHKHSSDINGQEATFTLEAGGVTREFRLKAERSKNWLGRNRHWPEVEVKTPGGLSAKFQAKYFTWGNLRNPGIGPRGRDRGNDKPVRALYKFMLENAGVKA